MSSDTSVDAIDPSDENLPYARVWYAVNGEQIVGKGNTPRQAVRAADELGNDHDDVFAHFKNYGGGL